MAPSSILTTSNIRQVDAVAGVEISLCIYQAGREEFSSVKMTEVSPAQGDAD